MHRVETSDKDEKQLICKYFGKKKVECIPFETLLNAVTTRQPRSNQLYSLQRALSNIQYINTDAEPETGIRMHLFISHQPQERAEPRPQILVLAVTSVFLSFLEVDIRLELRVQLFGRRRQHVQEDVVGGDAGSVVRAAAGEREEKKVVRVEPAAAS